MYKVIFAISAFLLSGLTYGVNINAKDQDTVYINLSLKDPNIISVDNDRIQRYVTRKGLIAGSIDSRSGIFTLSPQDPNKKLFSMVIFTEKGKRYTLLSRIKDIPSQDIIIKTFDSNREQTKANEKNSFKTDKLSELLVAMKTEIVPFGYKYKEYYGDPKFIKSHLKKNKEVNIKSFIGKELTGEVIDYKNILSTDAVIYEKEFISKNVIAVSVAKSNLKPNEITKIYRVIKNG